MKKIGLLFASIFILSFLNAQTTIIKGHLTAFNQFPISNLEVSAKKAKSAAITDTQGNFELSCKEKDIIIIKDPVFQTISKRVDSDDESIAINLIYKDNPKNRELATSLGYISQKDLDYALENLLHENNDYCNYPDISSLIKNKFPEVIIKQGVTGGEVFYLNRGTRSITGRNHAICMIDGIKTDEISSVNPCDITKISLVKSGTAARYGTGAANGVIVIETKRSRN